MLHAYSLGYAKNAPEADLKYAKVAKEYGEEVLIIAGVRIGHTFDSFLFHLNAQAYLLVILWGIYPGYPHGYTWAAPYEVVWPTRSRCAPQGYKVYSTL
jgi:hypothetical protein